MEPEEDSREDARSGLFRVLENLPLAYGWPIALAMLVLATAASYSLDFKDSAAGYLYLTIIVLVSFFDSLTLSISLSVLAVALLNYLFVEPRFTFEVAAAADVAALVAFVVTSVAVTFLVRQMRRVLASHQEQARLLDLTQRLQQTQDELAHASRVLTLGEMSASIAHEVNQPLAAIVTNGEAALRFLAMSPPEIDEVRGALERMVGEGRRAGEIVRRVRALTRKSGPAKTLVRINDVIEEIVPLVRREAGAAHAMLSLDLGEMLPVIEGDRVQLQQVVLNLALNAAQALRELQSGLRSVEISTRLDAGRVTVTVSDTGPGIPEASMARLFEPFFTTRAEGTGMGLSICRRIVEAHSGRIELANRPGAGAVVSFSVPVAATGHTPEDAL